MKIKKNLLLALWIFATLSFAFVSNNFAQQNAKKDVTGKVVDELSGEVLVGVTVKVKATNIATTTNAEGSFVIRATADDVLIFNIMGYVVLEKVIKQSDLGTVKLKPSQKQLEEVLVIGYGQVSKKDVTGAIGEVKMDELTKAPVASFDQALAGRVAGVQVSSGDGQPGSDMNIVIRGGNSLTQTNAPLYVVDGFPIEDFTSAALNPTDIKSISILKDASATAIYGSRAANGVVLIETKTGKTGRPEISYTGLAGLQEVTKTMALMDAYDFVSYQLELNPSLTRTIYFTEGRDLNYYKNVNSYDWQQMLFKRGFMQSHGINLAGGNSYTRYNISISAFNQDGTIINSGFDRYQGRLALDQQISPKLKSSLKINYSSQKDFGQIATTVGDNAQTTALMYAVWGYRPITGSSNPDLENEIFDDLDDPNDNRVNPIIATKNTLRQRRTLTLNANVNLVYDVLRDLQFKITAGINARSIYNDAFYNSRTAQGNLKAPTNTKGVNGSTGFVDRQDWVNENTLTYNKLFSAKHKLNIVAGFTLQGIKSSAYGYASQRIIDENVGIDGLATGNIYSINALETRNSLMSFLGRATYTFNRKYVLTSTLRADGSSKFSKGNRWGYFPSAAFAWNISDEKWMKKITPVSSAKLRVSYGLIGNNRVGDFDYLQQIAQTTAASYSFNDIPYYGAVPTNLGNSNLKWETTAQLDIGLDISFFNNRIEIIGDFYRKTTKDLLLNTNLRPSTGFSTTLANVGCIQNQGLELTLNTQNIKGKHFSWASSFNISFNENKLLALANGEINMFSAVRWYAAYNASYLYLASVGAPAAQFYGYLFDGIYQLDDFEQSTGTTYRLKPSLPSIGGDPSLVSPGDMKYKDINGDGTIDENDMAVMGRAIPIHSGGFNNTFNYKNFGLSVFFQWSYGNNIYNTNRMMFEANQYNKYAMNQYATYVDRWTPTNPSNKLPRAKARNFVGAYTSRVLEDGSYLRLKTVAFNYNFSSRFAGKIGVKKLMATAAGQNLLTWTKYSGMDPEVSVSNSILTPGFDFSAYPRGRVLTLGLQATL